MSSKDGRQSPLRTPAYTCLALIAFAANSVLCRLALGDATIDAASFSTIRLASGAITLVVVSSALSRHRPSEIHGSWAAASLLFSYAVTFSFAYLSLSAGTGALILFGAVQVTMILAALWSGERPRPSEWVGLLLAVGGLVYLVFPGLTAPSPMGSALMAVAGISWGAYTLLGRNSMNPLTETTGNFVRSVPLVLGISLIAFPHMHLSTRGIILAAVSGSLASGAGYVVWYAALKGLTATRAATVQLSVPVLAALGGAAFLSESITLRLVVSGAMILGGIGLAVAGRSHAERPT